MRRSFLYLTIAVLFALVCLFTLRSLGFMVSHKYEVDEVYWKIQGDEQLSALQKQQKIIALEEKEQGLQLRAYIHLFLALSSFLSVTILLVKRKTYLHQGKVHNDQIKNGS